MDDGYFHDAHEVYWLADGERTWLLTAAAKAIAEGFVTFMCLNGAHSPDQFEVVPV